MKTLKVDSISKSYQLKNKRVDVLRGVSMEARAGEMVVLQGPSGSGKTTFLSLLGGLDYPTSGHILYDDLDVAGLPLARLAELRRTQVAYVFQDYVLFDELSVFDNVHLALEITFGRGNGTIRTAHEWIERVGLTARADHRPPQLSGGEKQRVGVARALAKHPQLLLADEPTSNLDLENQEIIIQALADYRQQEGAIVLVATHDSTFRAHATRCLTLCRGTLELTVGPAS